MQSKGTVVTFPGTVKIVPGSDGKMPRTERVLHNSDGLPKGQLHPQHGGLKGTRVYVPAGKRADYELVAKKGIPNRRHPHKPHAIVRIVDDVPADVVHAELEHAHETTEKVVTFGTMLNEVGQRVPNEITVTSKTLTSITAKSLEHPELAGEGKDAAEAVANMKALIATKLAVQASAEEQAKRDAAEEAAKAAPDPYRAPAQPELVERKGDGGTIEPLDHKGEPMEKHDDDPTKADKVTREG